MTARSLAAASALLLAAGCIEIPAQPIDARASASALAGRSLDDPKVTDALTKAGLHREEHWSLDALTIAAWTLRGDVAIARADITAGEAATRTAGELPNPTLSLDPAYLYDNANRNVSPWTIASAIGFTIETGDKRQIRIAAATAETEARRWQLAETLWHARQDVRKAVLVLAAARQGLGLAEAERDLRRSYRDWVETQIRFGAAALPDRLAAQTSLAQAEAQLRMAQGEVATLGADLATAIGLGAGTTITTAPISLDPLPDPAANEPQSLHDWGLINRLNLRHALADYLVLEQALRLAL